MNFIVRVIINHARARARLLPLGFSIPRRPPRRSLLSSPHLSSLSGARGARRPDRSIRHSLPADTGAAAPDNKARTQTCPISLHLNSAPNTSRAAPRTEGTLSPLLPPPSSPKGPVLHPDLGQEASRCAFSPNCPLLTIRHSPRRLLRGEPCEQQSF